MNKKGVTILELLISISLTSIVVILLLRVIFSLNKINNNENYASSDEINRTEIIKNIESDFLKYRLNGLSINNNKITFKYMDTTKDLIINSNNITYNDIKYSLESKDASYDSCILYNYLDLNDDYYLMTITISVLINDKNTTPDDDLTLTYIGLKNATTSYPENYTCSTK